MLLEPYSSASIYVSVSVRFIVWVFVSRRRDAKLLTNIVGPPMLSTVQSKVTYRTALFSVVSTHAIWSGRRDMLWGPSTKEYWLEWTGRRAFYALAPTFWFTMPPEIRLVPILQAFHGAVNIWCSSCGVQVRDWTHFLAMLKACLWFSICHFFVLYLYTTNVNHMLRWGKLNKLI